MVLYILSMFCLCVATGATIGNGGDLVLEWPSQYSLEATRFSLTARIIEDYKAWKTSDTSRIDYNNGAVSLVIKENHDDYPYGVKYNIHPETNAVMESAMKCSVTSGSEYETLKSVDILPSTYSSNFTVVEFEPINDQDTVKFFSKDVDSSTESRKTIWATYDDEDEVWIPVRYEVMEYNTWLGSLDKHEIWDFYNFKTNVDLSVFDIDDYDCIDSNENSLGDLDSKHIEFIDAENDNHIDHVFSTFKRKFNKKYAHEEEHAKRRNIFKRNMRLIISTNRQNLGYKLGVNQFADRTPEEMKRNHQGLRRRAPGKVGTEPFPYTETKIKEIVNDLPSEYDLRTMGLVSEIKNQEECGSCWTFGTVAALEGALARVNGGKLKTLSNQAVIDCAWAYGGGGCNGGTDNIAYEWMMEYGVPTVADYGPYLDQDGFCYIKNMTVTYKIRGYTDVTPYSIGALKVAIVNHGPLSVSVHATTKFQLYSGGIFYDPECSSTALDHEVTLVGYGERDAETFWILKNSWGPSWGAAGYMLISTRDNNCGVATEPTYVVL